MTSCGTKPKYSVRQAIQSWTLDSKLTCRLTASKSDSTCTMQPALVRKISTRFRKCTQESNRLSHHLSRLNRVQSRTPSSRKSNIRTTNSCRSQDFSKVRTSRLLDRRPHPSRAMTESQHLPSSKYRIHQTKTPGITPMRVMKIWRTSPCRRSTTWTAKASYT